MTRIFISHSHADEVIAYKLFDFLICVFPELRDKDILCTSDPNSGLSFDSNTISDQLKRNLKGAEALVALITTDSLQSPWIPFEIGSFWTTEKSIVLILGPGLTPEKLPGPLKGWLSIRIEDEQAFEQVNAFVFIIIPINFRMVRYLVVTFIPRRGDSRIAPTTMICREYNLIRY